MRKLGRSIIFMGLLLGLVALAYAVNPTVTWVSGGFEAGKAAKVTSKNTDCIAVEAYQALVDGSGEIVYKLKCTEEAEAYCRADIIVSDGKTPKTIPFTCVPCTRDKATILTAAPMCKDSVDVCAIDTTQQYSTAGMGCEYGVYPGPTMTEWGLIIFAALFILTLIFVIRRRRAKLTTPA